MILLPGKLFRIINNTTLGDNKAYSLSLFSSSGLVPEGKQLKNGIVLLVVDFHSNMILYNPLSEEFNKVPNPPSHDHFSNYDYAFGFGYGTTPDDLKIIKIGRASDEHGSRPFDIFSFRTWSWNTNTLMIDYYFDYQYNELPPAKLGVFPLGTLKGNLCAIFCSKTSDIKKELWVMKEHGVWESWSKVSTLTSLLRDNCLWTSITKWKWDLESSRDFSVTSVRKIIDDKSLSDVDSKTRWIKYVPIKVNVHAWKVKTDSLPTRFNVSRRGIDIDSIMCAICDNGVETSRNLFFYCCMVRQIVRKITRWWDVPYVEVESYEDWYNWLVNLRISSMHKQMFEGIDVMRRLVDYFIRWRSRRMILLLGKPIHAIDTADYSMVKVRPPVEKLEGLGAARSFAAPRSSRSHVGIHIPATIILSSLAAVFFLLITSFGLDNPPVTVISFGLWSNLSQVSLRSLVTCVGLGAAQSFAAPRSHVGIHIPTTIILSSLAVVFFLLITRRSTLLLALFLACYLLQTRNFLLVMVVWLCFRLLATDYVTTFLLAFFLVCYLLQTSCCLGAARSFTAPQSSRSHVGIHIPATIILSSLAAVFFLLITRLCDNLLACFLSCLLLATDFLL
ncbi:RNA-directed DNA polymerase, eukaryota [Tanacetum coccineum]|uniref:RNA-directed DNA polymerase, eukaryota n=1 Tax=Tanacetum coccineum TaxID=301880 RepID=A0ABQ5BMI1_9ASTR